MIQTRELFCQAQFNGTPFSLFFLHVRRYVIIGIIQMQYVGNSRKACLGQTFGRS